MTRGNILDEVASFKEGKRQTCWFFALLASLFMLVPSATVGFASTSPTTGADAFRAPVQMPKECVKGFLWLEAEGFSDYGEWKLDTQFVHKMGSAYLLAAGVGKPVGSARLPFEPFLSPLLFRIVKGPARLPIESLEQGEVIAAGEGKDFVGLYLSDGRTSAGGRHVRVTGMDVLSDTPEGTALLDGILDYLVGR